MVATAYWVSSVSNANANDKTVLIRRDGNSIRPMMQQDEAGEKMKFYSEEKELMEEKAKGSIKKQKLMDTASPWLAKEEVENSASNTVSDDTTIQFKSITKRADGEVTKTSEKKTSAVFWKVCGGWLVFSIGLESIKRLQEKKWVGKGLKIMESQEKEYFAKAKAAGDDDDSDDEESDDEETDDEESDDEESDDEESDDEESDDEESDPKKK